MRHPRAIGRRTVLRAAALTGAAGLLASCGGEDPADAGRQGGNGRLRLAAPGAAVATLNAGTATAFTDYIAMFALYDPLLMLSGDEISSRLAESVEPNADATEFTVRIRPDITFHNGRMVSATDVAFSLRTLADPKLSPNFSQFYSDADVAGMKVVDARTLRIPLRRPRSDFVTGTLATFSPIVPDGTSGKQWEKGIGSGPFRLTSSTTDTRVLARNPDYWDDTARLAEVEIVAIADPEARLNALRGGQIDYAYAITPAGAASVRSDKSVQVVRGGAANSTALAFEMNITLPPFDNPDVRLAMKLLVDRQALVDTVLFGHGTVGNDVVGQGLVGYETDLPQRTRDLERARTLLRNAGVSQLRIRVAEAGPGLTDATKLVAEQAKQAGLTVELHPANPDTFYSDLKTLLNTPCQAAVWTNRPAATHIAAFTGSRAGFNLSGIRGSEYDRRLAAFQTSVDEEQAQAALDDLQRYLWESGGDLVWGYAEQLDATTPGVDGISYGQSLPRLERITMT